MRTRKLNVLLVLLTKALLPRVISRLKEVVAKEVNFNFNRRHERFRRVFVVIFLYDCSVELILLSFVTLVTK